VGMAPAASTSRRDGTSGAADAVSRRQCRARGNDLATENTWQKARGSEPEAVSSRQCTRCRIRCI